MFSSFNNLFNPSQAQVAAAISAMKGADEQHRAEARDKNKKLWKSEMKAIWERKNIKTQKSEEGFLS